MLSNARNFKKIYIATGYTDLRRGIERLAGIIRFQFHLDPYNENTIFLFCGKRCDRIKALIWEGDGFLLCYKRVDNGSFDWPRSAHEVRKISADQYQALMQGLEVFARHPIKTLKTVPSVMWHCAIR
ncbi:IS66 family insertion sequence element accessory protein TnpB [Clostridium sp. FS41]|uniref:IS66 family insertion sequence element accessory protein TnpB n=3 Tax=Clostridia TaxID=186801 RepID=UPI0005D3DBBC|nr:IS66 family insertion sequence element accessory protein TnpB [Clostridium sp. FS41]KJJ70746.1 IS66 Orf2 like protein [Clostridium sp. FS41]